MKHIEQMNTHIKSRDLAGFESMLSQDGFDINGSYVGGKNILHLLIERNAPAEFLQSALERGANPDKKWVMGEAPLHFAVKSQHEQSPAYVKTLLEHGANPNLLPDEDDISPLYAALAALKPNSGVKGSYLLKHGASVNPLHDEKPLALLFFTLAAQKEGVYNSIDLLIDKHNLDLNYRNSKGNSILNSVINEHQGSALSYMLGKPHVDVVNINELGQNALAAFVESRTGRFNHEEAQEYNKSVVDKLLQHPDIKIDALDKKGRDIFDTIPAEHSYLTEHIKEKTGLTFDEPDLSFIRRRTRP